MSSFAVFLSYFASLLALLRPVVFVLTAVFAALAFLSWSVRKRRISPFSALARFSRERIDPIAFGWMERRLVRRGGLPTNAPWWTVAAVAIGGLLLLAVLQFVFDQLALILAAGTGVGPSLAAVIAGWTFSFLRLAIMARVIASWVGGSRFSRWWRWSFITTDWFLEPLRRVLPTLGPIDISPLVAYFALGLLEGPVVRLLS